MTENVVDRLHRWSSALPKTEPLPVSEGESYEFVERIAPMTRFDPRVHVRDGADARTRVMASLLAGELKFLGHPVVFLK